MVKRILEMDPLDGEVVMTGGVVAHNDIITTIFRDLLNKEVLVASQPQLTGALGAALIGLESVD